jgi:hypothetical protein
MLRRAGVALVVGALACSAPVGGGGGLPSSWTGTYDATITSTVTDPQGAARTGSSTETVQVSQTNARVTWSRAESCVLSWTATDTSSTADAGQTCQTTSRGVVVRLTLSQGTATLTGTTINATLRWTLTAGGMPAGTLVETLAAPRRP